MFPCGGYFDRCLDCCLDQARVFDAASCLCSVKCQPKSKSMPRPPKKPKSLEAPNTPLGCTASSSAEEAHRSIDVYLDYNGVLNNGLEFREKLNVFMTRLEHIDVLNQNHSDVVRITLLSYRRYQRGCVHTLQELTEAGVPGANSLRRTRQRSRATGRRRLSQPVRASARFGFHAV